MNVSGPHLLKALTTYKPLIDLLTALAPVTVAAIVAYVGYLQWKTASDKFRFDLYQRRLQIYKTAIDFYIFLLVGDFQNDRERNKNAFQEAVLESQFLFDQRSGIYVLLSEIQRRSGKVFFVKGDIKYKDLPGDLKKKEYDKFIDILDWLSDTAIPELSKKFSPYLSFRDSWYTRLWTKRDRKYAEQLSRQIDEMAKRVNRNW